MAGNENLPRVRVRGPGDLLLAVPYLIGFHPERSVVLARELTKTFETFLQGTPVQLLEQMEQDANQTRGEFVIVIAGAAPVEQGDEQAVEADALLAALLAEGIGVKQGAAVAARLMGGRKQHWYARLQAIKGEH